MQLLWHRGKYFLLLWFVFSGIALTAIAVYGKSALHIALNRLQPLFLDQLFIYLTLLGETWLFIAAFLILLFRSVHQALFLLSAWLGSVLSVQALKKLIFSGMPRPARFFEGDDSVRFIEGVVYRNWESFPSGHTADVFSVCFALTLLSRKSKYGAIWFLLAVLVGYSRVYLSQHFMMDVLGGSSISLLMTSLSFYLWNRYSSQFQKSLY